MRINDRISIATLGDVDHGKSTILGHLIHLSGSLPEGKLEFLKETCLMNSKKFEFAFVFDSLKKEQRQGITIDVARVFARIGATQVMFLDCPGHFDFLKNLITGASKAEVALFVVDIEKELTDVSRFHIEAIKFLKFQHLIVVVNKMDKVNFDQTRFIHLHNELSKAFEGMEFSCIPVSGAEGDNLLSRSARMSWWTGASLSEKIQTLKKKEEQSFREPAFGQIQDIYKFDSGSSEKRILVGSLSSGTIKRDKVYKVFPGNKKIQIQEIYDYNLQALEVVRQGEPFSVTCRENYFFKRGQFLLEDSDLYQMINGLSVTILSFSAINDLRHFEMQFGAFQVAAECRWIEPKFETAERSGANFYKANLLVDARLPFLPEFSKNGRLKFSLIHDQKIVGCGVVVGEFKEANERDLALKTFSNGIEVKDEIAQCLLVSGELKICEKFAKKLSSAMGLYKIHFIQDLISSQNLKFISSVSEKDVIYVIYCSDRNQMQDYLIHLDSKVIKVEIANSNENFESSFIKDVECLNENLDLARIKEMISKN